MVDSSFGTGGTAPRILAISDEMAWPLITGYRRRVAQSLNALVSVGDVTWVACPRSGIPAPMNVPDGLHMVGTYLSPAPNHSLSSTARIWATSRLPWALAAADWRAADDTLASFAGEQYDLLWVAGLDAWLAAQRAGIQAKNVVMDTDVESEKLSLRLKSEKPSGLAGYARQLIGRVDVRRWRRLESRAGTQLAAASVCSQEEANAIRATTWTIPNSYPDPGPQDITRSESRLLFVGSLAYAPNVQGLEFFAREVFSVLHSRQEGLELRIVGRGLSPGHWLRHQKGVVVCEDVAEIGPEVASATVVVVPLLWGGGTRLKIIEAFAFTTPVISTTIGAAGLDVVDQKQLVLADSASELIAACESLLSDKSERERLGAAGRSHFEKRFRSTVIESQLVERFEELLA